MSVYPDNPEALFAWSAGAAIRSQREALGLSQAQLADTLGVTNSFLSHVESGNRIPTDEQIQAIASALKMPADLIGLGTGRLPPDVRRAFEKNAAETVAAVRQSYEAHAIRYLPQPSIVPSVRTAPLPPRTYIPERINAEKTSSSYRAHSYHTKVPVEAITPFIRAFTKPGDTVIDSFCGSGMTGVASLMEGRNALLSDLSPAAVHVARNYTTRCDPIKLLEAFKVVEQQASLTMRWLYCPLDTGERTLEYTTWSDVFRCPACHAEILYWDVARKPGGIENDRVICHKCKKASRKSDMEWLGERPVQSHTSAASTRIDSHDPTTSELALIESANKAPIPYWVPSVAFGQEREMWRASHRAMGITDISGFFSRRNLHALAALRHAIVESSEGRVREALMFAFTASVNRASRRYQWNAKRPTNVMTGTLYISSLRYEWNVWSLFRRKFSDALRYYQNFPKTSASAEVFQRSATDLGCLPDSTADMAFIDPPFGSNIFYADVSLLWDSWLGALTDESSEIVINKHRSVASGGKDLGAYGELMHRAFSEVARVVKKGGKAVLAFSNSDDAVWKSVQDALKEAGFETESAHVLNKGQPSIKGVKGVNGQQHVTTLDLLLCLKHKTTVACSAPLNPPPPSLVDTIIVGVTKEEGDAHLKRTDEIYSAVVRKAIEAGYSVSGITMPKVEARCRELGAVEKNGSWVLEEPPLLPNTADFISGYLAQVTDLPKTNGSPAKSVAVKLKQIAGGRDSDYYCAHSYHTKVPPESITPFIEHYTKPGDVVLDPFSGSGMTGVAAALAGRRCILNDLSPVGAHLAWNHTRPCDSEALEKEFVALRAKVEPILSDLYKTDDGNGKAATIQWTIWSTQHKCPECRKSFLLWDAMDRKEGRMGKTIRCPKCAKTLNRSALKTIRSIPAWICCETEDGKRHHKPPSRRDLSRANLVQHKNVTEWYPLNSLGNDREMYIRCALHLKNIKTVSDFYTGRNLKALALIWREILEVRDDRVRRALAFAFTNTAWHGTRMRRFNARGGQRPLTGTLYIPQLSSEANVLEVMANKIKALKRYYTNYKPTSEELPAVRVGSATDLSAIQDGSVDYIFTDPPFGSNIFYSDCNLIWESWLGRLTDSTSEAVVNSSLDHDKGGKSLSDYSILMLSAMREMNRVLKPGSWATVVFHNTDAEVWKAIRDAADEAGFAFHEASSLARRQRSHKGYKGQNGNEDVAHYDVIFNLRKRRTTGRAIGPQTKQLDLAGLVSEIAREPDIKRRGLQGVHAEVMRRLASRGRVKFPDYSEVRIIWEKLQLDDGGGPAAARRKDAAGCLSAGFYPTR